MLDMLSKVVMNEEVNKMSVKNCAIVMGPNLFNNDISINPMKALMLTNKAGNFLSNMLGHRLKTKFGYDAKF